MSSDAAADPLQRREHAVEQRDQNGHHDQQQDALPIHHSTMSRPPHARVGLVGQEEAAETPGSAMPRGSQADRERRWPAARPRLCPARRRARAASMPCLHVRRELAHEHRRSRRRPCRARTVRPLRTAAGPEPTSTCVPPPARASVAVTSMRPGRGPSRRHRRRRRRSSSRRRRAPRCRPSRRTGAYRAQPDGHLAVVLVVAEVFGELGPGQAGGHLRDVVEELPHLVDRLRDLEGVLEQHQASRWAYGFISPRLISRPT